MHPVLSIIVRRVPAFVLIALTAGVTLPVSAATLANYQMGGPNRLAPTSADGFLTASNLTTNNATTAYSNLFSTDSLGFRPNTTQATVDLTTTLANATYVSFTITPDAGYTYSLDSLTFGAYPGGATLRSFYLFSPASGLTTADSLLSDTYSATATGITPYSISLSSMPEFQNLTEAVEFRFYIQAPSATASINFSNITLDGTISAIPEPSTVALIAGAAALGVVALRRRRSY